MTNRGTIWIFRPEGHHDDPNFQIREFRAPAAIHTWACIGHGSPGAFCFYDPPLKPEYVEILTEYALPAARRLCGRKWQFGSGSHRGRPFQKWKKSHKVRILPWPASSPDLALMENVFRTWHSRVEARLPQTLAELRAAIEEEWNAFSTHSFDSLVASMPKRCQAIIAGGGWRIHY